MKDGVLTTQHVPLEVLCVQICLRAIRAGEFAILVLLRNESLSISRIWSARCAGQDTSTALLSHDVGWLWVLVWQDVHLRGELAVRELRAVAHGTLRSRLDVVLAGDGRPAVHVRMAIRAGWRGHHGLGGVVLRAWLPIGGQRGKRSWRTSNMLASIGGDGMGRDAARGRVGGEGSVGTTPALTVGVLVLHAMDRGELLLLARGLRQALCREVRQLVQLLVRPALERRQPVKVERVVHEEGKGRCRSRAQPNSSGLCPTSADSVKNDGQVVSGD